MNWKEKELGFLELTNNEIRVLECIDLAKSVQDIAKETNISRTGVNFVIKKLHDKELVKAFCRGKRKVYIAITTKELQYILEKAIASLDTVERDRKGVRIRMSKENEFIIHIGAKEIIPAYERIASVNKNERVLAIQHHRSYKEIVEKASSKLLAEFNQAIKKNNIILDGILNESAYKTYVDEIKINPKKYNDSIESLEGRSADYHVFPDSLFNYDAEIWIFKTTTLIINWFEEVAIEITNQNMTGFLKDMFGFVKEGSKKIDHNHAMREVLAKK
jgi:DNA-binding MarR family transcriptional regulator